MGKGKTKAHKAAGKKKEKRRAIKAAARKALPAKHRLHKLGKKAITPKKKGKAPAPDRFDHKKPLPNIKIPESITSDILDKKELLVAADFTNHLILRYLRKNPKLAAILHTSHVKRSAAYEAMKKWVRQELRVLVGMFVLDHDMKGLVKERTTTILSAPAIVPSIVQVRRSPPKPMPAPTIRSSPAIRRCWPLWPPMVPVPGV